MKIGIDARMYGPKWGGGGIGRYVEELVNELQKIDSENRFVLFLKRENFDACKLINQRFEKVIADAHWYTTKEQLIMPRIIDGAHLDLMHYPHWNIPLRAKTPFVVTIHDLILLEDPNSARATTLGPIRYAIKRIGYNKVLRHAIEKSKAIITVSDYVKGSILTHFNVQSEKIHVIYEGVSSKSQLPNYPIVQLPVASPYFLYVGSAYPHKNLESLLHAFSFFVKKHPNVRLVLVGKEDKFYKDLKKELQEIDIDENAVIFTGFVPENVLHALYANASLYIFPSRHEGFGLPPLEAMRHGVPVASSNRGPMPEVLGNAAIYFNPDDLEEMVEVMERTQEDEILRDELVKKGNERIKRYTWETMAKEIEAIYEK
ncbi:MAG: glycosyltransferase family 1 protein [Patescibacteria group bacterium]